VSDHIQFDTIKVHPENVRPGSWIVALPRAMTDELKMTPRMQEVMRIHHTADGRGKKYELTTKEGIYVFREGDRVEVIT
jgi:hypothetical protein